MTTSDVPHRTGSLGAPRLGQRAAGLGLIGFGVAPLVVIVGGVILLGFLMVQTVSIVVDRVATVAAVASREVQPKIADLENAYSDFAAQATKLKGEFSKAVGVVTDPPDLVIPTSRIGSLGGQAIQIPTSDIDIPGTKLKLDAGKVFNGNLPTIPAPSNLTVPMSPLRDAFAPFKPDGTLGQAIGKAEAKLGSTLGEVEGLKRPLLDLRDAVSSIPGPLTDTFHRIGVIVTAGGTVLAALVLAWFVVALVFIKRRWSEASVSYRSGGIPGLLLFGQRTMLGEGFSRTLGRPLPVSIERELAELQASVQKMQQELSML